MRCSGLRQTSVKRWAGPVGRNYLWSSAGCHCHTGHTLVSTLWILPSQACVRHSISKNFILHRPQL